MTRAALMALLAVLALHGESFRFIVRAPAEVVAEVEMSSPGADWSQQGREAALVTLTVDGTAAQHVMLYGGARSRVYAAFLGTLAEGEHTLSVDRHAKYSSAGAQLKVAGAKFREVPPGDAGHVVLAHAPVLFARADTIGEFTDVPLIAYCERLSDAGKPYLQYTVIFSNEDGGTSTRALMARWGRTTDIEYIYKAWLDGRGQVERATIQAKGHEEVDFDGVYEGTHPVLIPSTRNNMVSGKGRSDIRYQLPPELVDLSARSRESVMDGHAWSYRVMADELAREDKLRPYGKVDGEKVSDPRNYLYIDVKLVNDRSTLAVAVRFEGQSLWRASHLGRADLGLAQKGGWYRAALELPPGTRPADIAEIAFECLVAPARPENLAGTCRLEGVGGAFFLDAEYRPGPSFFSLREAAEIPSGQMRVYAVPK